MSNLPALHVLNGLMCSDIYSINRALRSGDPRQLDTGCGAVLDWEGWESRGQFVDAVDRLFADYQALGLLGSHTGQVAYRALWITPKHLKDIQRERLIWDDGYSFAAGEEREAASHLDAKSRSSKTLGDATVPLLVEFTLGRYTLTIPPPGETDPLQPHDHGEYFYLESLGHVQHILDRRSLVRLSSLVPPPGPDVPAGTWRAVGRHVY